MRQKIFTLFLLCASLSLPSTLLEGQVLQFGNDEDLSVYGNEITEFTWMRGQYTNHGGGMGGFGFRRRGGWWDTDYPDSDENFLRIEKDVFMRLGDLSGKVIDTGASVIYDQDVMCKITDFAHVIYIEDSIDVIEERFIARGPVPLMGIEGKSFKQLFTERQPLYEKYAQSTVTRNSFRNNDARLVAEQIPPSTLLDQIRAMGDRREALILLLRHSLLSAADATDVRFARVDTERDALRRLPKEWRHFSELDFILRETEWVHYGGRSIEDDIFTRCLEAGEKILGKGRSI